MQKAERAVSSEAKYREKNVPEVTVKEEDTPPSPLTCNTPKPQRSLKTKSKKRRKKTTSHHHFKSAPWSKRVSSRHLDVYDVQKYDKGWKEVQVLKQVNANLIYALEFTKYHLQKQSQGCNIHIFGRIAKGSRKMEIEMKTAVFQPSDSISVLSNFKTSCGSNRFHEGAAM